MRTLTNAELPITGFAGVRERVFIQDRRYFSHQVEEACWDAFGPLVYFANAWFNPRRSTGLHHHSNVDIVSVLPRGSMYHEGTIGHGETLRAGQAQIQRSGQGSFSHNEINPNSTAQPFLQLWLTPIEQATPSYSVINLADNTTTVIEERPGFTLGVGRWQTVQQWRTTQHALLYIFQGKGEISTASGRKQTLTTGTLIQAQGLTFDAEEVQFLYATVHELTS